MTSQFKTTNLITKISNISKKDNKQYNKYENINNK